MDSHLRTPILFSILAGLATLGLKTVAYFFTGSVSMLSDAAESLINLIAASAAYASLIYSAQPVDREHTYGHAKIEFFSSGLEGGLILVAAIAIAWAAFVRLLDQREIETIGLGMILLFVATVINGGVGYLVLQAGKKHRSIVLEADGWHLMTDVWTSSGVLAGLGLVWLTGWKWLDPVVALFVATIIVWTAVSLMRRSFNGLMDHALPKEEVASLRALITANLEPGHTFHALRTRLSGSHRFIDFHLLVPGDLSVRVAHARGAQIEKAILEKFARAEVTIHVEPIEEQASWHDSALLPLEKE